MNRLQAMQKGFTLIELMIVVAIIGILASIALPGYQNYVKKAQITEATTALSNERVDMEQFYQDNRTYVGGPCNTVTTTDGFSIGCAAAPTTTAYLITATGTGNMLNFIYTIDEANGKGSTTPGGGVQGCWAVKIGGGC